MQDRWEKRRRLQSLLAERIGCTLQYTGWPCGTCFGAAGLDTPHAWDAVLVLRGDYRDGDYGIDMPDQLLSVTTDALIAELSHETRQEG